MRIAIPLFGTRVAPRLDFAPAFLMVEVEGGEEVNKNVIPAAQWPPEERVRRLAEAKVDTLICGAIARETSAQCRAQGIQVYSWVTGEAEDALCVFLQGLLESGSMVGAGGRCCGRWRFRGGREKIGGEPPLNQ